MAYLHDLNGLVHFAITGGPATGKTTVARMFETYGVKTIDFDVLSREVVEPEQPAWHEIVSKFGTEILRSDETIDRGKLSDIVFADTVQRLALESIIHPRVIDEFLERVDLILAADPEAVVQAVVPLLYETHTESMARKVVVVYCPESLQIERIKMRDGFSDEKTLSIVRAQLPIEEKERRADIVIDNSETFDQTRHQVDRVWSVLEEMGAAE